MIKEQSKRLYRLAFVTSPLLGILTISPILLHLGTFPAESLDYIDLPFFKVTSIVIAVCSVYFVQWLINIYLLKYFTDLSQNVKRYIISYSITLLFSYFFIVASDRYDFRLDALKYYAIIGNSATNSFILIIINLVNNKLISENLQLDKAQLEISQLTSEQELLKQQIHPHFLFNALGTLQILIKNDEQIATQYAKQLAIFLRTSISRSEFDTVSIEDELSFCENYISLQQMRFTDSIKFNIDIPSNIRKKGMLPIFSLQLLAENAIKHNSFSSKNPLIFDVFYDSKGFLIIKNNISPKFAIEESAKIGLVNLTKRFSHFTDILPVVKVSSLNEYFIIRLKILGI